MLQFSTFLATLGVVKSLGTIAIVEGLMPETETEKSQPQNSEVNRTETWFQKIVAFLQDPKKLGPIAIVAGILTLIGMWDNIDLLTRGAY